MSGASLAEVASVVIEHLRFPLLDPDSLNAVEKENTKNYLIPVSNCSVWGRVHRDKFSIAYSSWVHINN